MNAETVHLFLNPKAGRGRAGRREKRIAALLRAGGLDVEVHASTGVGDLEAPVEVDRRQHGLHLQLQPGAELPEALRWQCAHCGAGHHPALWNWRQQGGAARIALSINGIFPSEALPGEELLAALGKAGAKHYSLDAGVKKYVLI